MEIILMTSRKAKALITGPTVGSIRATGSEENNTEKVSTLIKKVKNGKVSGSTAKELAGSTSTKK